jgi:ABC-type sugar transport system ATPase subunit
LIIDEVLAVGDLAFQRKCFDRMEELIKRQGKTVLLVSHNLRQVERLCGRVLCLNQGKIVMEGKTRDVCNYFYEENDKKIISQILKKGRWESSKEIELISCEMQDVYGNKIDIIESGSDAVFSIKYKCLKPIKNLTIVFGIHTTDFVFVGSKTSGQKDIPRELFPGIYESKIKINNIPLSVGSYSVRIAFDIGDPIRNAFYADNVMHFKVKHKNLAKGDIDNEGIILLDAEWIDFKQGKIKEISINSTDEREMVYI